jgi:hypothetical protein
VPRPELQLPQRTRSSPLAPLSMTGTMYQQSSLRWHRSSGTVGSLRLWCAHALSPRCVAFWREVRQRPAAVRTAPDLEIRPPARPRRALAASADGVVLGGERLRQLGRDLGRACLDQTGGVDAVSVRVRVARLRGDERARIATFVHVQDVCALCACPCPIRPSARSYSPGASRRPDGGGPVDLTDLVPTANQALTPFSLSVRIRLRLRRV